MQQFDNATEQTKSFHAQVEALTKNLATLNTMSELELKDRNNHLKSLNSFYADLDAASRAMKASAEDAKKSKDQMSDLANQMKFLKQIYESALSKSPDKDDDQK